MIASPEHEVAYQELAALVGKHARQVSALELLAIASNMVGKMIAMQDQRVTTVEQAMRIVMVNLEAGNQQVVAMLAEPKGAA